MPTSGSAIYTLLGATSPTYLDGRSAPGTFAGSLEVLFGARSSVTMAFSVAMPDGNKYLLNGTASNSGALFFGEPASRQPAATRAFPRVLLVRAGILLGHECRARRRWLPHQRLLQFCRDHRRGGVQEHRRAGAAIAPVVARRGARAAAGAASRGRRCRCSNRMSPRTRPMRGAWFLIGACRHQLGDAAGALEAFERSLALSPDPNAIYASAVALEDLGRPQDALARYDAALRASSRARGRAAQPRPAARPPRPARPRRSAATGATSDCTRSRSARAATWPKRCSR